MLVLKKSILTVAAILLLLIIASADEEAGRENIDFIIAIDVSKSLAWADPDGERFAPVEAVLSLLSQRTGDRIAIIRFAAWNETIEKGVFIYPPEGHPQYPLAEIPEDEAARTTMVKEVREHLEKAPKTFGRGTDLNVAFEKGIFKVLEKRKEIKSENKLQVELIADGFYDVVEKKVRPMYVKAAKEKHNVVNRATLNEAAFEHFKNVVVPEFVKLKNYRVNVTNPNPDEPTPNPFAQIPSVGMNSKPEDLLVPKDKPRKHERIGAGARETITHPVHVYEGAKKTKVIIIAIPLNRDYTVDLLGPDNSSMLGHEGVKIIGQTQANRIFNLTDLPSGDYTLTITNNRDKPTDFDISTLFEEFDLKPMLTVKGGEEPFIPGGEVPFTLELRTAQNDEVVTDEQFIADLQALVIMTTTDGKDEMMTLDFQGLTEAKLENSFRLPAGSPSGEYTLASTFKGLKDTDEENYSYNADSEPTSFNVKMVFKVSFELAQTRHEIGMQSKLSADWTDKPDPGKTPEEIVAKITEDHTGESREIVMKKESGQYIGTATFDKPGRWTIVEYDQPGYSTVPGNGFYHQVTEPPFDLAEFIQENLIPILVAAGVILLVIILLIIYAVTRPKFIEHQVVWLNSISRDEGSQPRRLYIREFQDSKRRAVGVPDALEGAMVFNLKKKDACIVAPAGEGASISVSEDDASHGYTLQNADVIDASKNTENVKLVFFYSDPSREELLKAAGLFGDPLGDDEFILNDGSFEVDGKPLPLETENLESSAPSQPAMVVEPTNAEEKRAEKKEEMAAMVTEEIEARVVEEAPSSQETMPIETPEAPAEQTVEIQPDQVETVKDDEEEKPKNSGDNDEVTEDDIFG